MNPLDLPVHPAVVHFPIALLVLAWVCVLLQHRTGSDAWAERARLLEIVGVATLPFTILAGVVDLRGLDTLLHPAWDLPLIWHVLAALSATALFTAHLLWRRGRDVFQGSDAVVDVVMSTSATWLLVLAGAIAGEMVYGG
ncbi:MAG: hypothetical protein M3P04_12440 [Actinomycetota bacterium]|nr:hypothetical protein [Actinomycetota bacterium]